MKHQNLDLLQVIALGLLVRRRSSNGGSLCAVGVGHGGRKSVESDWEWVWFVSNTGKICPDQTGEAIHEGAASQLINERGKP